MAGDVLQEVMATPEENDILKRLSLRRRRLVNERVRVLNSLQADLQAVAPGLLQITRDVGNLWFMNVSNLPQGTAQAGPGAPRLPRYCVTCRLWCRPYLFKAYHTDRVGECRLSPIRS